MGVTFIVPSIFTAVDKSVTSVLRTMGNSVTSFAAKAEAGIARAERVTRRLTPGLNDATKQFFQFASAAAITATVMSGINFSVGALKDYEDAITSVRVITGLSAKEFTPFKKEISSVAEQTKSSSIEVAKSFELIASANADLLKSPKALGAVSTAAITLSQATGMSIEEAAGSLTNSMNQFGVGAEKASEYVDILVTSQAQGTATVAQLAQSLTVAGGTAKAFGLDFDKTNALLQGFAKGGKTGAEAGTQLSGVLSKLSKVQNKNFNPVYTDSIKVIDNLSKANLSYTDLMKLTDAEGAKWLTTLLNQNKIVQELAGNQNKSGAAAAAAKEQNDTLSKSLDQLKAAWVNMLVGNSKATSGINATKKAVKFLTENLDTVVTVIGTLIGLLVAWKILLFAANAAMIVYNVGLGIMGALSGTASIAIGANTVALTAYKIALGIATAAQWLLNIALGANPIGLIIIAIAALIALIVVAVAKYNEWGAALTFILGPFGIIINLIQSFRRNWDMITAAFKEGGVLAGFKAIGATILDAVLMPLQQVFKLLSNLPVIGGFADSAVNEIQKIRDGIGVNTITDESGEQLESAKAAPLLNTAAQKEANMSRMFAEASSSRIDFNVNDPTGRGTVTSNAGNVKIKLTSTRP